MKIDVTRGYCGDATAADFDAPPQTDEEAAERYGSEKGLLLIYYINIILQDTHNNINVTYVVCMAYTLQLSVCRRRPHVINYRPDTAAY